MSRSDSSTVPGSVDPIPFLERAVATPSHDGVDEMRELVRSVLADRGVASRADEAGNLVASRGAARESAADAGQRDGPHLLLNTHLDTVSPHVAFDRDGDRLRGRGACDAKGPLAAMLAAFLATDPAGGRLTLALTPDEEVYSTGARALVDRSDSPVQDVDAVIVGEPTRLDVCTAAPGRFEGTIELAGERAHAAQPGSGRNAVDALSDVLVALETFDERDDVPADHPQLGDPTLTPTVVDGGDATNQVPATARLTVDRRPVPPEDPDAFRRTLLAHLRERVSSNVGISFTFTERPTPFLESWATDRSHPVVERLAAESGGAIRPFGAATEASYFATAAPTVVFGPGKLVDDDGPVAHADREYVDAEAVRAAAESLSQTCSAMLSGWE